MGGRNDRHHHGGEEILAAFAQQRLWFLAQLDVSSPAYNEPLLVRFSEPLDVAALSRALTEIVRRHEPLRTVFFSREGLVFQHVLPAQEVPLPRTDLLLELADRTPAEREHVAMQRARSEARQPFDLEKGPLFRASLIRLGDDDERLFLNAHHLVIDGLSYFQVLLPELHTLYNAFRQNKPSPLPELPLSYTEFSTWQRGFLSDDRLAPQLAYWKAQLDGAQELDLLTDFPRSAQPARDGARHAITLSPTLSETLKGLSRRYGVSLFTVILAAWKTLLYRYTGQTDVVVGTAVAGRRHPDLGGLIGFFSNSLVLRTRLDGNLPFGQLLLQVREVLEAAREHQDVPFERLVTELNAPRMLNRNPLYNTSCVVMPPIAPPSAAPHLRASRFDIGVAKLDLYLELHQRPSGMAGHLEYRTDLFADATIARLCGHFIQLLEEIARDVEQPLDKLRILTTEELTQLAYFQGDAEALSEGNTLTSLSTMSLLSTEAPPFPQLFEAQVARTPEAIAVVYQDVELSYRELNRRANQLAHYLRALDVGPDRLVGIFLERSIDTIVSLLAIHKAGGAYVPLDPAYPKERLRFMMEDAELPLVLTHAALLPQLPSHGQKQTARPICLDADAAILAQMPETDLPPLAIADHLAYVIYTSGSTGKPKGVLALHRGLSNLVLAQKALFDIGAGHRVLQFSSISFDMSVADLALALPTGAALILAPRHELLPGQPLTQLLRKQAITMMVLSPSVLSAMPHAELPALEKILVGGERCTAELVARWAPGRHFYNGYGPTECTAMATCAECDDPARAACIGRPLPNVQCYILDAARRQVPVGVPGELYLGGSGMTRGYLRRPELTEQRFIDNPLPGARSRTLYRTSDRVRWLPDGSIEFLGRTDRQIKLRGFRIEPAEIEAVLLRHPDVHEAAVLLHEAPGEEKRLAAYVVPRHTPRDNTNLTALPTELGSWLKEQLPDYMVPQCFMIMHELPLSPTGKLEASALPPPAATPSTRPLYEAPNSEIEQAIIAVWQNVLRWDRIGVRDNFFDLGGHSLLLAQVQGKLSSALSRDIRMMDLFRYPTVRELALHLSVAAVSENVDAENSEPNDASDSLTKDSRDRARRQRSAHRSTRARRRSPQ